MVKNNQPSDPDRKSSARSDDELEHPIVRWLESFGVDVEGDWSEDGWDEDLYAIGERYGVPPHVVDFFLRSLPRWSQNRVDGRGDCNDEDENATEEMIWEELAEVADASATWEEFAPLPAEKAEERRYDLTRLLLFAPMVITVMILAMVAFSMVTANDAVLLAAALLGPLYMPLGAAIAFHYNSKAPKPRP